MKKTSHADSGERHRLRDEEWAAGLLVCRCVGASPKAYDINGRQGAVDIVMTYPDGHEAALEITSHVGEGVRQRDSLLAKEGNQWKAPGRRSWFATVPNPQAVSELWSHYPDVVLELEEMGAEDSAVLYSRDPATLSGDLAWLLRSDVSLHAVTERTASAPKVYLLPSPEAGLVDTSLADLPEAVAAILAESNQQRHIDKLLSSRWAEKHLFIALYEGGLPFSLEVALMDERADAPTGESTILPAGITHLWLAPRFSPHLIEIHGERWTFHPMEDLAR
ncbi:hypothetical protein VR010_06050 [Actinomycetaceae bacterium L2_0104]